RRVREKQAHGRVAEPIAIPAKTAIRSTVNRECRRRMEATQSLRDDGGSRAADVFAAEKRSECRIRRLNRAIVRNRKIGQTSLQQCGLSGRAGAAKADNGNHSHLSLHTPARPTRSLDETAVLDRQEGKERAPSPLLVLHRSHRPTRSLLLG